MPNLVFQHESDQFAAAAIEHPDESHAERVAIWLPSGETIAVAGSVTATIAGQPIQVTPTVDPPPPARTVQLFKASSAVVGAFSYDYALPSAQGWRGVTVEFDWTAGGGGAGVNLCLIGAVSATYFISLPSGALTVLARYYLEFGPGLGTVDSVTPFGVVQRRAAPLTDTLLLRVTHLDAASRTYAARCVYWR